MITKIEKRKKRRDTFRKKLMICKNFNKCIIFLRNRKKVVIAISKLNLCYSLFFVFHGYDESVGIYDLEIPKSSSTSPHGGDKPRDHARTGTRPVKINISE